MLVLSRKKGQSIMIADNIEIMVVAVEGDTVRLGIRAPREVEVHRKEIYSAIQESNQEASSSLNSKQALNQLTELFHSNKGNR